MSNANSSAEAVHWTSGINVVAGLWLVLSPFILGNQGLEVVLWNEVIIGLAITVFALFRTISPDNFISLSWINFVFGIWLIVAPFILGYSALGASGAITNDITVGVVVLALAACSAIVTQRKAR